MKRAKQAILPSARLRTWNWTRVTRFARWRLLDMEVGVVEGVRFIEKVWPTLYGRAPNWTQWDDVVVGQEAK